MFIGVGPDLRLVTHMDQLGSDARLEPPRGRGTAFEDVIHPQLATDLVDRVCHPSCSA